MARVMPLLSAKKQVNRFITSEGGDEGNFVSPFL